MIVQRSANLPLAGHSNEKTRTIPNTREKHTKAYRSPHVVAPCPGAWLLGFVGLLTKACSIVRGDHRTQAVPHPPGADGLGLSFYCAFASRSNAGRGCVVHSPSYQRKITYRRRRTEAVLDNFRAFSYLFRRRGRTARLQPSPRPIARRQKLCGCHRADRSWRVAAAIT